MGTSDRYDKYGQLLQSCSLQLRQLGGHALFLRSVVTFRDVRTLGETPIGVKALGSNPHRSRREGRGERDATVSFGGDIFTPGDFLVSDDDGIVVLPAAIALRRP